MDCKFESAAKTFVRIETIILQGVVSGALVSAATVLMIPFVPFALVLVKWGGDKGFFGSLAAAPLWFFSGCLSAVIAPIAVLGKTFVDLCEISRMEWETRWMSGEPKKPNGHPLPVPTADEIERRDLACLAGVIRDYNGEARRYGQGLPIDERKL